MVRWRFMRGGLKTRPVAVLLCLALLMAIPFSAGAAPVGGTISGTVTSVEDSTVIEGVEVFIYSSWEGDDCWGGGGYSDFTYTEADGSYTFTGLPDGEYYVIFWHEEYKHQYWDGKSSEDEADAVVVTGGSSHTDIDAALVESPVRITGTVRDANGGSPLTDGFVWAAVPNDSDDAEWPWMEVAWTLVREDGTYALRGIDPGEEVIVGFWHWDYYEVFYDGKDTPEEADPVTVQADSVVTDIDADMTMKPVSFSGTVTDVDSTDPLKYANVSAFTIETGVDEWGEWESWEYAGWGITDADGEYAVRGLGDDEVFVEFWHDDYFVQYWNGRSDVYDADPLTLTDGEPVTGIDAALELMKESVTGTVTDAVTGEGIEGTWVTALGQFEYTDGEDTWFDWGYLASTETDSNGDYMLKGLRDEEVYISFEHWDYYEQYWEGKATLEEADLLELIDGVLETDIDAVLTEKPVSITGTVTSAATGKPLPWADVTAYAWYEDVDEGYGWYEDLAWTYTDVDGSYTLRGLGDDEVFVGFWRPGYEDQYYDGQATLDEADPIVVTEGTVVEDIDAALDKIQPDGFEPDDTPDLAKRIAVNGDPQSRTLAPAGDRDWAYFDAIKGATYTIETFGGGWTDTVLSLYGTDAKTLLAEDDDGNYDLFSLIEWTAPADGRYYIRVRPYGECQTGAYHLMVWSDDDLDDFDPDPDPGPAGLSRLSGADRYATSVALAREAFGDFWGVRYVVIASGEDRAAADPLSAAGLCGVLDAPLMLVHSGGVPSSVRSAIASMPEDVTVIIIGGSAAVPQSVGTELAAIRTVKSVQRAAGRDRYDTAREIADRMASELKAVGQSMPKTALLANGADARSYFDALALSAVSAGNNMPVLLLQQDAVPAATAAALSKHGLTTRIIGGGPVVVSDRVKTQLKAERWFGADRYGTAAEISRQAAARDYSGYHAVGVAASLPDALTGGATVGHLNGVLLLTQPDTVPSPTASVIRGNRARIHECYIFGGPRSVTDRVRTQIGGLLK